MKIAILGQAADVEVIYELLSPWDVLLTSPDEAKIVIVYKESPSESKKTIVIPSDSADFAKWTKDIGLRTARRPGETVRVAASPQTTLMITPQILYCYDEIDRQSSQEPASTATRVRDDLAVLGLDVVKEYRKILEETLNAKASTTYRLLTGLPIPYNRAPKCLRDLVMNENGKQQGLYFLDKLPLDALRLVLVRAIEKMSKEEVRRKTWKGKKCAFLMTHDIETRAGLQRAGEIKRLEEKYDMESAWYVPSDCFKLNLEMIRNLANHGEIGAHDTKHDGKLAQLPYKKLTERLLQAKRTLGRMIENPVTGFRAPILQHNLRIIDALSEVGYVYDTSIPTWEPKHPFTMKPHGIGTAYSMTINHLTEIPVTLPQDHQMLQVLGLAPREVVKEWLKVSNVIKELCGLCTFLVHPDYELVNPKLDAYEELLNGIISDNQAWITLPSKIDRDTKQYSCTLREAL